MSTSHKPDPDREGSAVDIVVDEADFLGPEFDETKQTCREALEKHPQLGFIAHFSQGVFHFSMDVLGQSSARRQMLWRLGRQLSFAVGTLDRTLREVRTGPLIRTVLQAEHTAVLCESVVPNENILAVCPDSSPIDDPDRPLSMAPVLTAADQTLSELVTALRARIGLPSLNPGGWASAEAVRAQTVAGPVAPPHTAVLAGGPALEHEGAGHTDQTWSGPLDACMRATRPEDLHFVAYCESDQVVCTADQLGHRSLRPFFTQISVDARRRFYQELAGDLKAVVTRLNGVLTGLGKPGRLVRVVLDVEQGAVYCYRLDVHRYLVGVTIDQARVSGADDRMAELALAWPAE